MSRLQETEWLMSLAPGLGAVGRGEALVHLPREAAVGGGEDAAVGRRAQDRREIIRDVDARPGGVGRVVH